MIIREACVESFQEAVRAQELGAERIELCARLDVGGITPSYALIESVKKALTIPVMVMIRPRGGDFNYNGMEMNIMRQNIETCKMIGVTGVVFGFLEQTGIVDMERTRVMTRIANPMEVTFHKAIDDTPDPVQAIDDLKQLNGITRVLSSGGADSALEGATVLNEMIIQAVGKIIIMAGGSITCENLEEVTHTINTREFHGRKIVGILTH